MTADSNDPYVTVRVAPDQRAVLISTQLLDHYRDWTRIGGPTMYGDSMKQIEIRVVDYDGAVVDVQSRFVDIDRPAYTVRVVRRLPSGKHYETSAAPQHETR